MTLYMISGGAVWDGCPVAADGPNGMTLMSLPDDIEAAWTDEQLASFGLKRGSTPADQLWAALRTRRDALLSACDYTQLPDVPDSATKTGWATYRQALRDLPANTVDPADPVWPAAPVS